MAKQRTEGTRKKDCHLTLNILVFTIIISIRFYNSKYEFCMYQNQLQIYLCSEFCVVMSVTISSSCLSEGLCLICYLCQFAQWSQLHNGMCFCFVFLRLVYPMLPLSLDCQFLIAHSVFSNFYLASEPWLLCSSMAKRNDHKTNGCAAINTLHY